MDLTLREGYWIKLFMNLIGTQGMDVCVCVYSVFVLSYV
jgi:hypothetical protein